MIYLQNCFLLLISILLWNLVFTKSLPKRYIEPEFQTNIPLFIKISENLLRILVFSLTLFMKLSFETPQQKTGFIIYCLGIILYFLSWIFQIKSANSTWSKSLPGFMAPAYTPLIWLCGIGLIGNHTFFFIPSITPIFISLSILFIITHLINNYYIFQNSK